MKRIYLDMCAIQRPLDTPNQIRIVLESDAVLGILALFEAGQIEIVSSDALLYETSKNPLPIRRDHAEEILSKANVYVALTEDIDDRAQYLIEQGIHPLDALHLAFAEKSRSEYFCTCDDRLLRRAQTINDLQVEVISPIDLIRKIEPYDSTD